MDITNINNLANDTYTVLQYSPINTKKYGWLYQVVMTISDADTPVKIWSNSYITSYIEEVHPSKKFTIIVTDKVGNNGKSYKSLTIPGYRQPVTLQ